MSRTARRITVAIIAAALAALAALPASSAGNRAVSHHRRQFELVAYVTRTQWRDPALAGSEAKLARREARERARRRRERAERRREERLAAERAQQAKSSTVSTDSQVTAAPAESSGSPQQIAEGMLPSYGWGGGQFTCLDQLWNRESGWNVYAFNPGSGATGIPQALPGNKMSMFGSDWRTSAWVQIKWGLFYIQSVYGSPCAAWGHEEATSWY